MKKYNHWRFQRRANALLNLLNCIQQNLVSGIEFNSVEKKVVAKTKNENKPIF